MSDFDSGPHLNLNPVAIILEFFHNAAARPWVYNLIQRLAGQRQVLQRMSRQTATICAETVVDVGGGTGASRRLWPAGCRYICLDIELPKLEGFRSRVPGGLAILSDADGFEMVNGLTAPNSHQNVGFLIRTFRRQEHLYRLAQGLGWQVAEQLCGAGVPSSDRAVKGLTNNRVIG